MIDINKQSLLVVLVLAGLLTINATTPNVTKIPNEAEGTLENSDESSAIEHAQQHGAEISAEEEKSCEANDGKYKDGKCKFKVDDSNERASFDHDLVDKGLYDNYAQRQALDKAVGDESSEEDIAEYNREADESHDESGDVGPGSGRDEDNNGKEDSNGEEWENNDYKDDAADED